MSMPVTWAGGAPFGAVLHPQGRREVTPPANRFDWAKTPIGVHIASFDMGAGGLLLIDTQHHEVEFSIKEAIVQQESERVSFDNSRPKLRQALRVHDLPVMIGGGVLGMILGEGLTVSPIVQWALIGVGIVVGVLVSIVDRSKPPKREAKS
jgi:hypothetical protein